jgi:hypothetical protein
MLCTEFDDYVCEKCIWVVTLSDGTKVFQDDDRPGMEPASAWIRLKKNLIETNRHIESIRLRFRTHIIDEFPHNRHIYYYSRGLIQAINSTVEHHFHVIGWLTNSGNFINLWYKAPELVKHREVYKNIEECQPDQLIWA